MDCAAVTGKQQRLLRLAYEIATVQFGQAYCLRTVVVTSGTGVSSPRERNSCRRYRRLISMRTAKPKDAPPFCPCLILVPAIRSLPAFFPFSLSSLSPYLCLSLLPPIASSLCHSVNGRLSLKFPVGSPLRPPPRGRRTERG